MAFNSRPYSSMADLAEMQSLVSAAWLSSARPRVTMTVGDLEWWMCLGGPGIDWSERVRLWTDPDGPIAWGWFNPPDSLEMFVRPDLGERQDKRIRDEILDWGTGRVGVVDAAVDNVKVWAADGWREADFLRLRGFASAGETLTHFYQPLSRAITESPLPAGYSIRAMNGAEEIPARVDVHRAAFAPSKMTIEKYETLISLPHYSFDNDIVVIAPDGSLAAFTMCWFDQAAAVGEFEPVGTHPDHRRLGLGKAANTFGLRRLQELGARDAIVFSDNAISGALYRSVGFEALAVHRQYQRSAESEARSAE